jgi:hypothetical protein
LTGRHYARFAQGGKQYWQKWKRETGKLKPESQPPFDWHFAIFSFSVFKFPLSSLFSLSARISLLFSTARL